MKVQKYSKYCSVYLLLQILTFVGFSQSTENQLIVINTKQAYLRNIRDNPGQSLILLENHISPLFKDVVYKTTANFTRKKLYRYHRFFVAADAALRVKKIHDSLKTMGLGLLFFDTYRPYRVTKTMWKIVPDERYAANPAKGSGHNRGIAVDVTLADLATGKALAMPTGFDNFSDTAHHDFMNLPSEVLENRALLKGIMEHFGFRALQTEWWHYSLPGGGAYPVHDIAFRRLKRWMRIQD